MSLFCSDVSRQNKRNLFCFRHVCDGLFQCSGGHDEIPCHNHTCTGLFKCTETNKATCLHPVSICDGFEDCLSGEDEYLCDLPRKCPAFCNCLLYAISCKNVLASLFFSFDASGFVFVKLEHVSLNYSQDFSFPSCYFHSNVFAVWIKSELMDICHNLFCNRNKQILLDYSYNSVSKLTQNCFLGFTSLQLLRLNNNRIRSMHPASFLGLTSLTNLDLSSNKVCHFSFSVLSFLKLDFLNLSNNAFLSIDFDDQFTARVVATEDYRICCMFSDRDTECAAEPSWPQSCGVLLDSAGSNIIILLEFVCILSLNSLCFAMHVLENTKVACIKKMFLRVKSEKDKSTSFSKTLMALNVNDFLFGVYLLSLFFADVTYAKEYVVHSLQWLNSRFCVALGILSTFMVLNSPFLLLCIAFYRYVALKYPFSVLKRGKRNYLKAGFIINFIIAVAVFLFHFLCEKKNQMPSSACLLLGETFESHTVKYATAMMAGLQIHSLVSIAFFYHGMLKALQQKNNSKNVQRSEKKVLVQSILVTATNALCWLPSSAIYIVSISSKSYPPDLLVWNAILVNPLNSLINPMIFTLFPLVSRKFQSKKITK